MSSWVRDHETHIRGGRARWAPRNDWRTKYGTVPVGDPLKASTSPCFGCRHPNHPGKPCGEIAFSTKKPCECPGAESG